MKLAFKQIDPFLKKPDPAALLILIYGPDEGLVGEREKSLARQVVADIKDPFNVVEISPAQLKSTPSLLLDEAQSMSMLGGRRVVRLGALTAEGDDMKAVERSVEAALAALQAGDNLVLVTAGDLGTSSKLRKMCEDAKNAAAVPCYVEDERDLTRVIAGALKEQGFAIESDALTYMAANVVGDRAVVRGEVEKLITYMGADSKRIRLDDVSACIGDSADLSIDLLAKLAAGGNFAEAERILNYLLGEGTSFVFLTRNLQNYFLRLHLTKARLERGEQLEPAMAKLRPAVFWKHKDAFAAQAQSWAMPQIEQALAIIMTAEAKCKQTGSDPALLLSRALLAISQTGQRALSRRRA